MSYKKQCDFCPHEIIMSQRLGKWYPSDLNGGIHRCEGAGAKKKELSQSTAKFQSSEEKQQEPQLKNLLEMTLLIEQMNDRLTRVERIVVDPRR